MYLPQHEDKPVILDEIQRTPQLFRSLRGLIDSGRRHGRATGRFLLLGSASIDLLKQSSESLAGRIRHLELALLDAGEVGGERVDALWLRGGFPESLLAASDAASLRWRVDFIRTYLERDIPQLGLGDREGLLAHPVAGGSWEGMAIESLIAAAPAGTEAYFFRTAAGAEIDLLLRLPGQRTPWAIEIKRGLAPKLDRGFHVACDDVGPERRRVVYGGVERFPLAEGVEAVSLLDLCAELSAP